MSDRSEAGGSEPASEGWAFCQRILVSVSRSFALIIPECPPPIDRALCAAYLLCRIADTIEDEPALGDADRAALFLKFLACVDRADDSSALQAFLGGWPGSMPFSEPGYGELVRGTASVLGVYHDLPAGLARPIHRCVHEMVAGMRRIAPVEIREGISFFCRDLPDLDRYCHIVAGTVGVMSTALFEWRLAGAGFSATAEWREQGRRLGLGLQMTNIIKDCRVDAERGVSFIPARYVRPAGGNTGYDLTAGSRREIFDHAIAHLDAGLDYTLTVPRSEVGLRRFLLGSLLPAIATLEVAAVGREFHPKIHRDKMIAILDLITADNTEDSTIRAWYVEHSERTRGLLGESNGRASTLSE